MFTNRLLPLSRFKGCFHLLKTHSLSFSKSTHAPFVRNNQRLNYCVDVRKYSKASSAVEQEVNLEVRVPTNEGANDENYVTSKEACNHVQKSSGEVVESIDDVISNPVESLKSINCTPGYKQINSTHVLDHDGHSTIRQTVDKENTLIDVSKQSRRQLAKTSYISREEIMSGRIGKDMEYTNDTWEELCSTLQSTEVGGVNEKNIDMTILGFCLAHRFFNTGLSYINFLTASGHELSVVTISNFLKLCFFCPSKVNDEIESLINSLYNSIRVRHSVLDATTAENVLHGICVTKQWKEGLNILDEIRLTCTPNSNAYSLVIKASFDNDDPDTGWDLISKMISEKRSPQPLAYKAWLQYCSRIAKTNNHDAQVLVEKLLHFFASNDVRLSEEVAIMLRLWYEYDAPPEEDWYAEFTTIDLRGMCKCCHKYLKNLNITRKEFESLRYIFVDKVLVGKNIFLKSTPEELEEFQKFIERTAPYDVVIDGLNVAYIAGSTKGNPRIYAGMLQSVVQYFARKSEKVLVLGRQHMRNWPREYMDYIYKNAEVFLTQNVSQDDPYLLYAAMYSGIGTRFISKDLMRSHSFLLKDHDPKLHSAFIRWQKQHQYHVQSIGENGYVKFRPTQKISTSAQCSSDGSWHIPYDLETDSFRNQDFNPPRQWLCLSHYMNSRSNYED